MQNRIGALAVGKRVILRDRRIEDVERFIHWQTHGEWRSFDAPWERQGKQLSVEDEINLRQRFVASCHEELSTPRKRAMIATTDGHLIGFVNRYPHERFPALFLVGMSICEDEFLNRSLGTEALTLWVDYLFANSSVHRIGAATWSFNPRAIALLKKVGFTHEGTERELHSWQEEWRARLGFGLLRSDWEKRGAAGSDTCRSN
jgi:RimJ/RimL family protein N-acetyltransferase